MFFVPGVKTVGEARSWAALAGIDSMRGEEVEVAGLLATAGIASPVVFLHCGSHHKLIVVGAGAVIERSVTCLTGELLAAIRESTVLASSLASLDAIDVDRAAVAAGMRLVREHGFARAAFLVRAGGMLAGFEPREMTCFLLGGLAALDEQCLERAMPDGAELVIYGGGVFPPLLAEVLAERRGSRVRVVDPALSARVATVGAVRLLEARLGVA
jgi:2-dehydro-3-deoxygalactonokinase